MGILSVLFAFREIFHTNDGSPGRRPRGQPVSKVDESLLIGEREQNCGHVMKSDAVAGAPDIAPAAVPSDRMDTVGDVTYCGALCRGADFLPFTGCAKAEKCFVPVL